KALEESKRSAAANAQYSPAFCLQVSALALLVREAEARAALAVLQQLQPDLTITRNKEDRGYRVATPEFHRLIERYLDRSLTVARYMILKIFISIGYRLYSMYLGCLF